MLSRGLLGSVLVLLGGLVVSTLPRSAPILEVEALADLRGAEAGRMLGLAVVLTGCSDPEAGFVPNPLSAMYASTKAFLTMFATSLSCRP